MKLRTEFVTNSSSSSFGAAIGDVILGIAALGTFLGCKCSSGGSGQNGRGGGGGEDDNSLKDSEVAAVMAASEQAAKEAAENLAEDAEKRDAIAMGLLTSQESQLAAQADKIKAEMDAYNKQWQDAQQGVDPKDPGYADFKKQYDDYQDYLKGQLDDVNSQLGEIQTARMQEQIARDSKSDWVKQRQEDLVQVSEQKAFLEAVAKGYGSRPGYDIDDVNRRLKDLTDREAELKGVLKDNNADINYTPKPRDPIGPDPEMDRLNQEYKAKKAALEKEINEAKDARDAARRKELEKKQEWLEKDAQNRASQAAMWDFLTKSAQITQVAADAGVDILSKVTGPAGQTIKTCYTGLKGVAGGVGEGLANGDMSKNVLKGAVGGLSDIVKDKVGDKFGKAAQGLYTVGSEAGKGALEAGLDGKDMVDGAISGGMKGTLDVGLSAGMDKLLPPKDLPSGLDWSNANVKDAVNYLKGKNPLTNSSSRSLWQGAGSVTGISRTAVGEGLAGAGKDQLKGFLKGDEVPVIEIKQGLTGQGIETATPYVRSAGEAAGKMALKGANAMSQAVKNAVNDPGIVYRA